MHETKKAKENQVSKQFAQKVIDTMDGTKGDKQMQLNAVRWLCEGEIKAMPVQQPKPKAKAKAAAR